MSNGLGIKKRICNDDLRRANERASLLAELGVFTDAELVSLIDFEAKAVNAINGICDRAVRRATSDGAE